MAIDISPKGRNKKSKITKDNIFENVFMEYD